MTGTLRAQTGVAHITHAASLSKLPVGVFQSESTMSAELKNKCEAEWGLHGAPMPDTVDWKAVYDARPLDRNLVKNPSPHGLSQQTPPPEPDLPDVPFYGPPRFEPDGNFSDWTTSIEQLPYDRSGIPEGAVICQLPKYSWFTMEQMVDLKAEGMWEELLDEYQPEIIIEDWYEESQLNKHIYELHVKLLGADKSAVIAEHSVKPTEELDQYAHKWKQVSHKFSGYGPGVRYVLFQHRLKNSFLNGFHQTRFTGSSVMVKAVKSG